MTVGISPVASAPPMDDDLYREIILDHYRHPRHRGPVVAATGSVEASNPLCGDEVELSWRLADGRIAELGFTGRGCSICMAATSMLCEQLSGCVLAQASEIVDDYRQMLLADGDDSRLGDLMALRGVAAYPVRIKCAILAANALQQELGTDG